MARNIHFKRRKAKKQQKMSHEDVAQAVNDYLRNGGKITMLKPVDRNVRDILTTAESAADIADEYLMP